MNKPKIALVVDIYNWAFYNRSIVLKEKLAEFYDIKIFPADTALQNNMLQLILLLQDYDLVHFFWRRILFNLNDENYVFKRNNIKVEEFLKEKFSNIIKTTSIPDHLYLEGEELEENIKAINYVDDYYVISNRLYDIYSNIKEIKNPFGTIYNGVELDKFKPQNLERFKNRENRKLILGWSGNTKWGGEGYEDIKGSRTILFPAIEELKKEGYDIELNVVDSSKKRVPHDEMPKFYNSIDMYVCASKTEGAPNQIMESMACGVPIITTDVGVVREVLGEKQKNYILKERSIPCLKEKIKEIYNNQEKLEELSEENLQNAPKYTYEKLKWDFKNFFDYCLNKYKK